MGDFYLGENSHIDSGYVTYTGNGMIIGKNVLIATNCILAHVNHSYIDKQKLIKNQGFMDRKGRITIEDDVWIGTSSPLLDCG